MSRSPTGPSKSATPRKVESPFGGRAIGARRAAGIALARALIAAAPILAAPVASARAAPGGADADRLALIGTSAKLAWNGVAATDDGRIFVDFPRVETNAPNPSLAELKPDNALVPVPGGAWNAWKPGGDPAHQFVSLAAIRIGPDGDLWALDNGATGQGGRPPIASSQKIVVVDPRSHAVTRIYALGADVLKPRSAIAEISFNGSHAYITDAGAGGLIVLDLATGKARRVLDRDPSTLAERPAIIDGKILRGPDGKPIVINADQLEVSPDGAFLYYQPLPGPLYRVATRLLDDPSVSPALLSKQVEFWYNTPSLGGTAIDRAGNLYLADLGSDAILKLTPDRRLSLVIRDPRLHGADAPCFDGTGDLLIPTAQLGRASQADHGHDAAANAAALYRLTIGDTAPARE